MTSKTPFDKYEPTIETELEVLSAWARGETCYTGHNAKAEYIVIGMSGETRRAACGNHASTAMREVRAIDSSQKMSVTVWVRP